MLQLKETQTRFMAIWDRLYSDTPLTRDDDGNLLHQESQTRVLFSKSPAPNAITLPAETVFRTPNSSSWN